MSCPGFELLLDVSYFGLDILVGGRARDKREEGRGALAGLGEEGKRAGVCQV